MKKIISVLLAVCLAAGMLVGCQPSTPAQPTQPTQPTDPGTPPVPADAIEFKIGHVLNTESPFHAGGLHFAELISAKSNGVLVAEVFPSALLGNDRELAEGLQLGTVDMAITATAPVSGFAPKIQIFDLPYLFRDAAHAYKVLDGELGDELLEDFYQNSGIVALAFWENGFRHITNSKRPIYTAEDVRGLKIRVQEISSHIDYWRSLGADPTPMAWTEVYTALQQGTVDGQENPVQTIYTQKVFEVQENMSLTFHCYAPTLIMISEGRFNALDDANQQIMKDAAKEAATYQRQFIADLESVGVEDMPTKGVNLIPASEIDMESFRAAAQGVWDTYGAKLGVTEMIAQIQEVK